MIDAKYLLRFKRVTGEDLLVAGLIESICDVSKAKSILDIGAGTGLISLSLQRSSGATVCPPR